ncbi:MAG: enoyl-CoA hydratase/isomerase family protein [Alphaproteobacteria bacterium]|nr:enoyl-CoA hydratase/isomerase family protein [Alphaproteobacteria bacterium]
MSEPDVLFATVRGVGRITLNRPKALNALTHGMVLEITDKLAKWAADDGVREVVITGAGERAFCAGGDVVGIAKRILAGEVGTGLSAEFFREEYRLNRIIRSYQKPYVAILDGITMGGGVGLSIHGRYRIATERTVLAMPEMAIGFFPDVGGGYVLARFPGMSGLYMALSGARARAADCVYLGAATHYVSDGNLAAFVDAIGEAPMEELLDRYGEDPGTAPMTAQREAIDRCFAPDRIEGILAALDAEGGEWAEKTATTLRRMAPLSLSVAQRQLVRAATLDFDANMVMEYRLCQRFMAGHDFAEGVRALLIDKDNAPAWQPANLEAVTDDAIEAYFAPLGARDLTFD